MAGLDAGRPGDPAPGRLVPGRARAERDRAGRDPVRGPVRSRRPGVRPGQPPAVARPGPRRPRRPARARAARRRATCSRRSGRPRPIGPGTRPPRPARRRRPTAPPRGRPAPAAHPGRDRDPAARPGGPAEDGLPRRRGRAEPGDGRAQPALRGRCGRRVPAGWTGSGSGSPAARAPTRISEQYATGSLSLQQMKRLVAADAVPEVWSQRALHRLWPDFPVKPHIDGSCVTIKADAARRAFNAYGDRIVWAVVDSGSGPTTRTSPRTTRSTILTSATCTGCSRRTAARPPATAPCATRPATARTSPGSSPARSTRGWPRQPGRSVRVTENRYNVENPREPLRVPREVGDTSLLAGHGAAGPAGQPQGARRRRHDRGPGGPVDPRAGVRPRRSTARASRGCASTASTSASATSSTRSGSPAGRARCARRSTSWSGRASWWSSRRATPATAR